MQILARTGHPDFLDLPWSEPLEEWEHKRLVQVVRGISRHVVRFVEYEGAVYALKELPHQYAHREYHLLRELSRHGLPGVEVVGIAHRPALEDILITRHLEYSLPYRILLARRPMPDMQDRLRDALANLLVRLHLSGFFWGDCSGSAPSGAACATTQSSRVRAASSSPSSSSARPSIAVRSNHSPPP